MVMYEKRLSEQIQEKMYEKRLRRIELLNGKSEYELRKKANIKMISGKVRWKLENKYGISRTH